MSHIEEGRVFPQDRANAPYRFSRKNLAAGRARILPDYFEWLESRELLAANPVPVLAVTGNGLNIAFHDLAPRVQDNTDFGKLAAGLTSANATFIIKDAGAAPLTLTGANPVTFTGSQAANFSVQSLASNTDGTSTLVIHFAPASAGTTTATVNIASNDPKHADFTFGVRGTLAFTDYAAAVGVVKVPPGGIVSNGRTTFTVPVIVTNPGGLAVSGTASSAEIQVFLHNTTTGTDTLMTTLAKANLAGLTSVGSRTFNLKVTPAAGFTAGDYTFLAVVNGNNAITESNPLTHLPGANNSAQSAAVVAIAPAHVDITGTLISTTLLPAVTTSSAVSGKLVLSLVNTGNVPLPPSEKVSIQVVAHNTSSGDIVLQTINNISVANLGSKAKPITLTINDTSPLAAGTYQIEANVTPSPAITEDSTVNNLITENASGNAFNIISAATFNNLTGVIVSSSLPRSVGHGAALHGAVVVKVINAGNTALPAGQQIVLNVFANAVPLAGSPFFTLGALAPGASKLVTININLLDAIDNTGVFTISADINPIPGLVESNVNDNDVTLNLAGQPITLTVT